MMIKPLLTIAYFLVWLINIEIQAMPHNDSKIPSPIILVPGDGGSRAYSILDYRLFKIKSLLWVNFEYMVLPGLLGDVFKLQYDPKTHKTNDTIGSRVYFPGWGSTDTIEELDERIHIQTTYFSPLVNFLIKDSFYQRNKTIRGAPYDFRKAPNENENFVADLQALIENTFTNSGNERVLILGHSLGSLYSLFFLKNMTMSWKQKYVRAFLTVSGPLAGAVKALSLETSGAALGSPRKPIYFRDMERSFPSTAFLLPNPILYGHEPIVITPKKNYSAYDYKELFEDMQMPYGYMMYKDTSTLVNGYEGPEGVDEVYCIHSFASKTPKQLIFTSFPDKQPEVIYGDGDVTVNIKSLEICKQWKNVKYLTMKGYDHMKIVGEPEFLNKLKQILYKQPNKQFTTKSFNSKNNVSISIL